MIIKRLACGFLIATAWTVPAPAAAVHMFDIPAGPIEQALIAAGNQGQASIGFTDPALRSAIGRGLSGRMTTAQALSRLLDGTGFEASEVRSQTFRIVRLRTQPKAVAHRQGIATAAADPSQDIVVSSSKRGITLDRLAGSALVVSIDQHDDPIGITAIGDLGSRLPIIQSTALGPGRDKLFLRGIADSSFAGPTQSTIGSYFGETRLQYSGPDPNLRLYDIDRIELLIGPQGTLYGAGAIGGIVRISPNLPSLDDISASLETGIAVTQHGGTGHDVGAMVNVPVIDDRIAVRAVGYQAYEAGYIDDPGRGKSDVNGVAVVGGRIAVRFRPAPRWTIDVGAIDQSTEARDLQYATRASGSYSRSSAIDQPFSDDFLTGYGTVAYATPGGVNMLVTVGATDRRTHGSYDASGRPSPDPIVYEQTGRDQLVSAEARIWQNLSWGATWFLGASALINHDAENRSLGPLSNPRDLVGVDNRTRDIALFGEATVPLPWRISATLGGRLTHARTDGQPLDVPGGGGFFRGTSSTRFDPSVGLVEEFSSSLSLFGRYGVGFRTGGLAVAARVGRTAVYDPDKIRVMEAGLRFGDTDRIGFSGHASLSYARWSDIQADLVATNGFPYTANVGNGRIVGFETMVDWRPSRALLIGTAAFVNRSRLTDPAPAFVRAQGDPLPDTPKLSGNFHVIWSPGEEDRPRPQFELATHYVGHSRLGVGSRLSLPQGGYGQVDFGASLPLPWATMSVRVDNLTDHRGNRFAVGNPLLLGREIQFTPLRPRTFRLTFTTAIGKSGGHYAFGPSR